MVFVVIRSESREFGSGLVGWCWVGVFLDVGLVLFI